jgi:hypothetical protein
MSLAGTEPELQERVARDALVVHLQGVGRRRRVGDRQVVTLADMKFTVRAAEFVVVNIRVGSVLGSGF